MVTLSSPSSSSSSSFLTVISVTFFLVFSSTILDGVVADGETCEIDGTVYQINDVVPFQTRCGVTSDFPCFCAPGMSRQVYCPYCSHATQDGSLICMKDGESSTFIDTKGVTKTCSCSFEDGPFGKPIDPADACEEELGSVNPVQFGTSSICTIELPDGSTRQYTAGEELGDDVFPNRCGADAFPCFCDPSAPRQVSCPYCRFPQSDGTLLCATDGETVNYIDLDDVQQQCSCTVPSDPAAEPITDCDNTDGVNNDNNNGNTDDSSSNSGSSTQPDRLNRPEVPPATNLDDSSTDGNQNSANGTSFTSGSAGSGSAGGTCTIEVEETGEIITFARGESYGVYKQTRCGSTTDYPCFCNPDLPMEMECPYCGFVTSSGELRCGRDGEIVTFEKKLSGSESETSTDGSSMTETCLCEIPDEPGAEPIRTCGDGVTAPPTPTPPIVQTTGECILINADGAEVIFKNGDSLGDLVEGVCGSYSTWPAICNTELVTAQVRSATPRDINNGIEYPYCIFTDTSSGDTLCARNGNTVTYTNTQGDEMECTCQYLSPGVVGSAQSQCTKINQPTSSPGLPPYTNPPMSASAPLNNNNNNNKSFFGSVILSLVISSGIGIMFSP